VPAAELALLRHRREQTRAEVAKETVVRPSDPAPVTPA
jgi:hypothetical protein